MSSEHGVILKKLGAEIVFPEKDMAVRLASRLETERMLDFVQLSEKINVSKMNVPDKMIDMVSLPSVFRRSRNFDMDLAVLNSPMESKPVSGPISLNIFVLLLRIAP